MDLLGTIAAIQALAWLLPNHYLPWTAAWGEGLALAALCALAAWAAWRCSGVGRIATPLAAAAAIGIASVIVQHLAGHLVFAGDAVMVVFYLFAWLLAIAVGSMLGGSGSGDDALHPLMTAWLLAAIASVGIALVQWTGSFGRSIYIVDLPPNAAPWSNVASRTQFASICFFGLCCLGWLHHTCRVGAVAMALGAGFLMLGMVVSTARLSWLQMAWLLPLLLLFAGRDRRLTRDGTLAIAVVFAALVGAWPALADLLLLSSGRSTDEQLSSGFRLSHWVMMLDAIGREPWTGYGWLQASVAQQRVALDFAPVGEQIDSSHNLVLDLLLWCGIPLGLAIVALLLWWFVARLRFCRDGRAAWLLAAIGGLFLHAMVEYPLQYAYFLIPAGILIGALDAALPGRGGLQVPRAAVAVAALGLATALVVIGRDYLRAEEYHRRLRFEAARIGVDGPVSAVPELGMLSQLQAYLEVVRHEPAPGMSDAAVAKAQFVADRFGHLTVMLNAALAAGLNGRPDAAAAQLQRICHVHRSSVCAEAVGRWRAIAATAHPVLQPIAVPTPPPACRTAGAGGGCT